MSQHIEELRRDLHLEVPGVWESGWLMVVAILLHGPVDLITTSLAWHMEGNPLVSAIGVEAWLLIKLLTIPLLGLAWAMSREHPLTRLLTVFLVALGIVLILPNIPIMAVYA